MSDREKLIELLRTHPCQFKDCIRCEDYALPDGLKDCWIGKVADKLLANGILVSPCKIGDDTWWIDGEAGEVKCCKNDVCGFVFTEGGVLIRNKDGDDDLIGSTYCFLSKEDAEAELKRRLEGE